jgi:hypothetical protein
MHTLVLHTLALARPVLDPVDETTAFVAFAWTVAIVAAVWWVTVRLVRSM